MKSSMILKGKFRAALDGLLLPDSPNLVTLEGLNALATYFKGGGGQPASWYIGLIDGDTFTSMDLDDTAASHPNWSELLPYTYGGSSTTRIGPLTLDYTLSVGNPTIAFLTMLTTTPIRFTDTAKIQGYFLTSVGAKESGSGIILAEARSFPPIDVVSGNRILASYLFDIDTRLNKTTVPSY